MNIRHVNARRRVSRLYGAADKSGRTMSVFAYNKAEAKAEMRKRGFRPVGKIHQT